MVGDQKMWTIGSIFMEQYYIVYDMTPHDQRNEQSLQVGIAKKNPENLAAEVVYNPCSIFYNSSQALRESDSSMTLPGWREMSKYEKCREQHKPDKENHTKPIDIDKPENHTDDHP